MRGIKFLSLVLVAVLLIGAAAGCGGSQPAKPGEPAKPSGGTSQESKSAELKTIRIGYIPVDSFSALFLAADKHMEKQGLKAEMVKLSSGADILAQVSTNGLQIGGGALGAAGYNALRGGMPVKYVAPLHDDWSENVFVINKKAYDAGEIKRPKDLKGKKIAINAKGVATEWQMTQMLKKDGLTLKDVTVTTMPFPDMVPALETGAIMAGTMSEPFATMAEEKGVGVRLYKPEANAKPEPITMIFLNTEWASKNPDLAKKFMIAYLNAARDLAENNGAGRKKDENLAIISKYTNLPVETLKKTRPTYISPNLEVNTEGLMAQQKLAMDLGYLKYEKLMEVKELIDFTYVEQAVKELGKK